MTKMQFGRGSDFVGQFNVLIASSLECLVGLCGLGFDSENGPKSFCVF